VADEAGERPQQLFRQEVLDQHLCGRETGDPLRISPVWSQWTFTLLLVAVAFYLAFGILGHVSVYATGPAVVRFEDRMEFTALSPGRVTSVEAQPGQRLSAGQVLVRFFDDPEQAELERFNREFELHLVRRLRDPSDEGARQALTALRAEKELAESRLEQRMIRAPRAGTVTDVVTAMLPGEYRPLLLGYLNQPPGTNATVRFKARFAMVDTESAATDYAYVTDQWGASLGAAAIGGPHEGVRESDWVTVPADGRVHVRFRSDSSANGTCPGYGAPCKGVIFEGYDYQRYETGGSPVWPRLRLPGQYHDPETDLFENWNRYYDPGAGRYLAPEPIAFSPEDAVEEAEEERSLPIYAYAYNNPIALDDPTGNRVRVRGKTSGRNGQSTQKSRWHRDSYTTRQRGRNEGRTSCEARRNAMTMSRATNREGLLARLQEWYLAKCDGDWEHSFGIKIDTLDNPGWMVTIDLAETRWSDLALPRKIIERNESDWVQTEVVKSQFIGCGGVRNLEEILSRFFWIVEGTTPAEEQR
jgi:RHS repeat-associated protein